MSVAVGISGDPDLQGQICLALAKIYSSLNHRALNMRSVKMYNLIDGLAGYKIVASPSQKTILVRCITQIAYSLGKDFKPHFKKVFPVLMSLLEPSETNHRLKVIVFDALRKISVGMDFEAFKPHIDDVICRALQESENIEKPGKKTHCTFRVHAVCWFGQTICLGVEN